MGRGLRSWGIVALFAALNVGGWIWARGGVRAAVREDVRVVATLPGTQLDGAGRLSLQFDRDLASPDLLGQPLADPLYRLEPALAGHWEWSATDRLSFVPVDPFPPGRLFRAVPVDDFAARAGRALEGSGEQLFRTRALRVLGAAVESAEDDGLLVALTFNQPVAARDLQDVVEIEGVISLEAVIGRPVRLVPVSDRVDARHVLRGPPARGDEVIVRVRAGLRGPGAELGLEKDGLWTLGVPQGFALLGAEAIEEGSRMEVALRFSHMLASSQDLPTVRVEPPVEGLEARVQSNRLRLEGAFRPGLRYALRLEGPVLSATGKVVAAGAEAEVDLPDLDARVSLPYRRGVLSPRGHLELDLRATNVAGVRLKAWRVHDNNLVAHVRGDRLPKTSREVAALEVPLALERNTRTELALDLRALTGGLPGVYHLEAEATDVDWRSDSALVTVTDLALVAKRQADGLFVWVVSLLDGQPVEGAMVESWSYNGQRLAGALTGADGSARLEVLPAHPDGPPYVVLARSEGDVAFVERDDFALDAGTTDVSGRAPSADLDVLLYAARDVHRPGDDVHLTAIVRDAYGQTPPVADLLLRAQRPDGRELAPVPLRASAERHGLVQARLPTRDEDPTGPWRLWVTRRDEERPLGETFVLVEPFLPVRIELQAQPERERAPAAGGVVAQVAARYLIGRPAEGLPATLGGRLQPVPHRSERFPEHTFEAPPQRASRNVDEVGVTLDAEGRGRLELPLPDGLVGSWEAQLAATVREPGGRAVSTRMAVDVIASERHLGLLVEVGDVVAAERPFEVAWVQVDTADAPAPGPARLELVRVETRWEQRVENDRLVWTRVVEEIPAEQLELDPGAGEGRVRLSCPEPGAYLVRGVDQATGLASVVPLRATADGLPAPGAGAPDRIALELDRERYAPGETARVRLVAPFAGRLLLTLEGERLLAHRVVEVPAGESELELELPAGLRGGAFVAASLVRAVGLDEPSWSPHRAAGLARLLADHEARRIPVLLAAPERAAPGERVAVTVDLGPIRDPARPPLAQVWLVDEGILLAGGTRTPDPFEHFLSPRRASIETAETWGELLPDVVRAASVQRIGGDSELDELRRRRRSPVPARRRQAAVVVLDAVAVDADGRARLEVELPDLTGAVRLMVVAVDGDAYGSSEQRLTLTTPITAEATWPRAVAPGDRFDVPVRLFNLTEEAIATEVSVEVDGPLSLADAVRPLSLEPGESRGITLEVLAEESGQATARVRARAQLADGRWVEARDVAELAVRPASVLHTEARWWRLAAGEARSLTPEGAFEPEDLRVTVSIGPRPEVELRPVLRALVGYPHGCVEQTSSRLLALLHAPAASDEASGGDLFAALVDDRLRAGLTHLESMQTRSGGLAYWAGGREPSLWGSAYAASVLARAERRGVELERPFVERLLDYLEGELAHARDDLGLQAEVCAALAAFQRPSESWMAFLSEQVDRLDLTARALLARAWLDVGRRDRCLEVLGEDALQLTTERTTGGRLVSEVRAHAALLETLLALDPEHAWVAPLVQRLEDARKARRWDTTLSMASALVALSAYQELDLQPSRYEGLLRTADGQVHELSSLGTTTLELGAAALPLELETRGEGPVFASLTAEGRSAGPVEAYDRGLEVWRRWLGRDGQELDPSAGLRTGDLVLCEVTLRAISPTTGTLHNVAIVDALPGGLEVESPNLATSAVGGEGASSGLRNRADRVEFGDDRVVVFTSIDDTPRSFTYALRAVAVGEFALPALQASCMYDPQIASVHGGGTLRVER